MGPFDQAIAWSEASLVGPRRFLERVWKLMTSPLNPSPSSKRGVDSRAASGGEVNVMREDTNPHESGKFSEAILKNAPSREENYLKVKKIM